MELTKNINQWLSRNSITIVRVSLGIIFLWFGALKFVPEASPAEIIAKVTVDKITLGLIPGKINYFILAIIESATGIFLIGNFFRKKVIFLALMHIIMTFSPIILFPEDVFSAPMVPTLLGQYIIKNLVIFSSLLLIYVKFCNGDKEACVY